MHAAAALGAWITPPFALAQAVPDPGAREAAPQAPADGQLPTVQVTGRRQSGAYHEGQSAGATKTETRLLDVPQAVRVLPRQLLDDLGALRLDDTLDFVAGVSRQNSFGGTWDNIAIRGFQGHEDATMSLLRNGMPSNRGFNAPRDTANLERIEFLKGTVGALYGASEPGGTVNLVTKAPRFKAGHAAETYLGSFGHKRLALDSTGPLNGTPEEPATLAYRLNVSVEDKDGFRDHTPSRRELLAPALSWKAGPDTQVRYDGELLRQRAPLDRGVPLVNGQLGAVPDTRFYGEPGDGDIRILNQTHQLFVDHALDANWLLHGGLQLKRGSLEGRATEPHQYGPGTLGCATSMDTRDWLCRRVRQRDFNSDETSVQLEATGKLRTGTVEHTLLVGAEAARFGQDRTLLDHAGGQRFAAGVSVSNPRYGQVPALTLGPMLAAWNGDLSDHSQALYVQDEAALTRSLRLMAGWRQDRARTRFESRVDGSVVEQDTSAASPRAGLSWTLQPGLSAYASVGRSFRAQTETDASGHLFAPQRGTAREAGLKWEAADGRLGGNIALFDILKRHVPRYDGNTDTYVEAGTLRNRGVEVELAGWVARQWRVALAYAFLDADPLLTQYARHSGSLFAVHEMPLSNGGLVGLGGGVTHMGARTGEDPYAAPPRLPAYTIAKLTAYWRVTAALRLSLDVDNVFDKAYYASAYNRVWVTPGSPRAVTAGLQYKF